MQQTGNTETRQEDFVIVQELFSMSTKACAVSIQQGPTCGQVKALGKCQRLWSGLGVPGGTDAQESACQCRRRKRCGFNPWVRKIPWRREWPPTPVFLPGEPHGQRSLVGYSLWTHKELDTAERLSTHASHVSAECTCGKTERETRLALHWTSMQPLVTTVWPPEKLFMAPLSPTPGSS